MRPVMRIPSRARCVVRCLSGIARPSGGPARIPDAGLRLALMGLLVGVCLTVLPGAVSSRPPPEVPGTVVAATMRLLRVPSPQAARPATVVAPQASRPHDGLTREDGTLDDDDPWDRVALPAARLGLPPTPFRRWSGVTDAYPWPTRYLVKPQLLTRL
jgi:hypothetical protein